MAYNMDEEKDWWEEMTEEQRQQQELADENIRLGRNLISHKEAMKRVGSWLKERQDNSRTELPNGIAEIVQMLLEIDDVEFLEQIHLMTSIKVKQKNDLDWWNNLIDEKQAELERAREEIKNEENLIPHEELMAILRTQLRNSDEAKPDWWNELDKS